MAKVQLIGAPFSSYVWVVRMVCEEKGVEYDLVPSLMGSPDVTAIHPFGKVPVMRHGGIVLFESKAIATYIDRVFAGRKLIPDDPHLGALVEQWVSVVNTTIDPCLIRSYFLAQLLPLNAGLQPDRAAIEAVLPTMRRHLEILDRAVSATGYLAGASFSLADINLLPVLHYIQQFPDGAEMYQSAPNLVAYYQRHRERPSFKASLPPAPPALAA